MKAGKLNAKYRAKQTAKRRHSNANAKWLSLDFEQFATLQLKFHAACASHNKTLLEVVGAAIDLTLALRTKNVEREWVRDFGQKNSLRTIANTTALNLLFKTQLDFSAKKASLLNRAAEEMIARGIFSENIHEHFNVVLGGWEGWANAHAARLKTPTILLLEENDNASSVFGQDAGSVTPPATAETTRSVNDSPDENLTTLRAVIVDAALSLPTKEKTISLNRSDQDPAPPITKKNNASDFTIIDLLSDVDFLNLYSEEYFILTGKIDNDLKARLLSFDFLP